MLGTIPAAIPSTLPTDMRSSSPSSPSSIVTVSQSILSSILPTYLPTCDVEGVWVNNSILVSTFAWLDGLVSSELAFKFSLGRASCESFLVIVVSEAFPRGTLTLLLSRLSFLEEVSSWCCLFSRDSKSGNSQRMLEGVSDNSPDCKLNCETIIISIKYQFVKELV